MEENKMIAPHKLQLDNRKKGTMTGVTDVKSFDEKEILLDTKAGTMTIRGSEMTITRLNLEKGELDIGGKVDSIVYTKDGTTQSQKGKNMLARLFK